MKNRLMFVSSILLSIFASKIYLLTLENLVPRYSIYNPEGLSNWVFVEESLKNLPDRVNLVFGDSTSAPAFRPKILGKDWINLSIQATSPASILTFISKIPDNKINTILLSYSEFNFDHNLNNPYFETINPNSLPSFKNYFINIIPEILKMKDSKKLIDETMEFFLSRVSYIFSQKRTIKHYLPKWNFLHLPSPHHLKNFSINKKDSKNLFTRRLKLDNEDRGYINREFQLKKEEVGDANQGHDIFISSQYMRNIVNKLISKLSKKSKCVLLIEKAQHTNNIYQKYYLQNLNSYYQLLSDISEKFNNVYFLKKPQVFPSKFFADGHHLNAEGATKSSHQLRQYLKKVFNKCQS